MTKFNDFASSMADRNDTAFRMMDEGKTVAEIAAALNISEQIVRNICGDDGFGGE